MDEKKWTGHTYKPVDALLLEQYNALRESGDKSSFCFAPLRSMYFGFHGKALPCCENLTYDYGTYPENSLHEIWFGEKRRKFVDHVLNNDLSLGCSICSHYIKIKNFKGVKSRFYDNTPVANEYPSRIEFQLANTCNLECSMCDGWSSSLIRTNRDKLPAFVNPYDAEFVRQLEEFIPYLKQAHFVGGEPFVIKVFYEIWERILALNPSCLITVQTNATVLNDKVKNIMERGNFSVNVSLDSLKKETYEKIRKNATFEKTLSNIDWFIDYCKRKDSFFYFTPCPMQNNWGELPDLVRYANEKNVRIIFHTVLFPQFATLLAFSNRKLVRIHRKLSAVVFPESSVNEKFNKNSYDAMLYQLEFFYTDKEKKKEWKAFDAGQKKELKEEHKVLRDRKNQQNRLTKQLKLIQIAQQKRLKAQQRLIARQNRRSGKLKTSVPDMSPESIDHSLRTFFWNELSNEILTNHAQDKEARTALHDLCKARFDEFFAGISDPELEKDIIITIYSNVTLSGIVGSLEISDGTRLFNGYLMHKNKKDTNG